MILTQDQIDQCCRAVLEHARNYDLYSYMIFDTLYKTGLRINELLEYSRVSILDTNYAIVETQKFSNPRVIPLTDFNPVYISHLASETLDLFIRSYSYYSEKVLLYSSPFRKLYINKKRITTHLYRHNFVKKLHNQGQNIEQISAIIGEREHKNTLGYVYSQISSR